jgi:hypothetical protein
MPASGGGGGATHADIGELGPGLMVPGGHGMHIRFVMALPGVETYSFAMHVVMVAHTVAPVVAL